jgi:hypothetical protein
MQARLFDVRMGTAANKRRVLILWTTGATAYTPTEQPLVQATPASEYFRIAWPSGHLTMRPHKLNAGALPTGGTNFGR